MERRQRGRQTELFEEVMKKFSKINQKQQTTDPRNSENTCQDKAPNACTNIPLYKLMKTQKNDKSLRQAKVGEKLLT